MMQWQALWQPACTVSRGPGALVHERPFATQASDVVSLRQLGP